MKLIAAFFKLTRWRNLLFIILTQYLFYYSVFNSLVAGQNLALRHSLFALLVLASVVIAAAGYIINDYFDLNIDVINKPSKVIVDRIIRRRWAIIWHLVFSGIGIALSLIVSFKTGAWIILFVNIGCVLMLWLYSTNFKKRLLSGNILIAVLTAWVIIVVYFFAGANQYDWVNHKLPFDVKKFFKLTTLYAGFAFIVSLIREVLKDLEDMEGDAKYKCKTMPIQWGVPATKVFIAVWLVVCIALLVIVQLYAWQLNWWYVVVYAVLLLILPLLVLLKKLGVASVAKDYHKLSSLVKLVMLSGILTMLFFLILK